MKVPLNRNKTNGVASTRETRNLRYLLQTAQGINQREVTLPTRVRQDQYPSVKSAYRLESEIVLAALAEITVRRAFENFAA